jgi:hypothetical protein
LSSTNEDAPFLQPDLYYYCIKLINIAECILISGVLAEINVKATVAAQLSLLNRDICCVKAKQSF